MLKIGVSILIASILFSGCTIRYQCIKPTSVNGVTICKDVKVLK